MNPVVGYTFSTMAMLYAACLSFLEAERKEFQHPRRIDRAWAVYTDSMEGPWACPIHPSFMGVSVYFGRHL